MPAPDDPLAPLTVIDRLEVGPVRLEPRRLSAPYRVVRQGRTDAIELQYSYEQDVFDPADPAARNLAAVTAAQVALNYGLFCRRIVLHGRYDDTDRRFLTEMARNTAREIYVNKLLEPNPFLVGAAVGLPAVRRESYLRAELQFEPEQPGAEADEAGRSGEWAVDRSRHVVLSSGGKDSLLSQGLLDEIGVETHPVFVNESGRHWFTALNAYRHFAEHVPNTSRVWTNSDRVFARLLRHLPFVRPDFAGVRSDEYPIRLWTVAVFIFGALPVLRRRGIGRLVIGDEYDTTLRRSHRGITHYDGLYDQSRWFDNALTRYYRQKRWNVAQFSILRPLSELLIEKVLTARYPHLQRHQTSCHATHTEEHRVRPCGRCEKCHRIVGMLKALDADPTVCGYTPQQIDRCLNELPGRALHQEAEVTQQLAVMLWQRGLIPEPSLGALEHPEVLKLRFDPQRSPIDTIPTDLRGPLYTILMEQADGAVRRHGKVWIDYDPLNDPTLSRPYAFESPARGPRPAARNNGADPAAAGGSVLGEFTWPQARQRLQEVDVALLPVGAIEQHGPHLPLDTDAFDAAYLARKVAEGCTEPRPWCCRSSPTASPTTTTTSAARSVSATTPCPGWSTKSASPPPATASPSWWSSTGTAAMPPACTSPPR